MQAELYRKKKPAVSSVTFTHYCSSFKVSEKLESFWIKKQDSWYSKKCEITTVILVRHKTEVSLRTCNYQLVYKLYITLSGEFKNKKARLGYKNLNSSPWYSMLKIKFSEGLRTLQNYSNQIQVKLWQLALAYSLLYGFQINSNVVFLRSFSTRYKVLSSFNSLPTPDPSSSFLSGQHYLHGGKNEE